jgi:cytoskeletal protein CcmA (bactofilin family)
VFKNKKSFETKKIDTLIGKEASMKGKLEAKGIIRIEGAFEGEIHTASDLIVGEKALVVANIRCRNATLGGRVEGNVNAENKLDIRTNGILIGDIKALILTIEDGAYFEGNCKMEIKDKKNDRIALKRSGDGAVMENKGDQGQDNGRKTNTAKIT